MGFMEELSDNEVLRWLVPIGIGIAVTVIAVLLRNFVYWRLHKWSEKTETQWDDILIHSTRFASLLWCFWVGLYAGIEFAVVPESWEGPIDNVVPILFVAMGIYTGVIIVRVFLDWYMVAVAEKTASPLDDLIIGALGRLVPLIAAVLGLFVILDMAGIEVPAVWAWLRLHGPELALLTIIGLALVLAATAALPKIIRKSTTRSAEGQTEEEVNKRVDTLSGVLVAAFQAVVVAVVIFMMLSEIGLNISPILAGVGVVGIAIGFGAQSLVKDILAGLFIIMENQYRKGDVVRIADTSGLVEDINMRRTLLRDLDGIVHSVPNGEIRVASNLTKGYSRVNMNIGVGYGTDLNHAIAVINRVGKELAQDPAWAADFLTTPQVLRIDNLGDSGIDIKIMADTKPTKQWAIMGELRLRLKKVFDEEGIEIPWPHTKVYFGNALVASASKERQ
jgi:moderate conductance mechanosensitive channel